MTEKVKRGFFSFQVVHGSTHFSFLAPSLASPSAGHLTRIFEFGNVPSLRCLPLLSINPTNTTHPPKYASTDRLSFGHLPPILISQTFHILFGFGLSLTDIPSSFFSSFSLNQDSGRPCLVPPPKQDTKVQAIGQPNQNPSHHRPPTAGQPRSIISKYSIFSALPLGQAWLNSVILRHRQRLDKNKNENHSAFRICKELIPFFASIERHPHLDKNSETTISCVTEAFPNPVSRLSLRQTAKPLSALSVKSKVASA